MILVPCDGADQREVATLLLGLAREKGIATDTIRLVYNGFEVPDELLAEADKAVVAPEAPKMVVMEPRRRGRPAAVKDAPKTEE